MSVCCKYFTQNCYVFCRKKSKPHDVIQLSCKTRPCNADNHYRCKKSCPSKTPSMVHSSSAPAKLDRMACPQDKTTTENSEKVSQDQVIIGKSSCSANKSAIGDSLGGQIAQHSFSDECSSEKTETNDHEHHSVGVGKPFETTTEPQISISEMTAKGQHSSENEDFSLEKYSQSSGTLLDKDDEQQSSSRKENFEQEKLNEVSIDSNQHDTNTEVGVSKELNQSETNSVRSLMDRLVEGSKKLSNANNSPKARRKRQNSNKTSDELPKESEMSLGLTANLKKNIKNRFADVSISFRKNDDTVNTSEVRWQSENAEDAQELPRTDGKRNFLAAAQERGRTFIPELKNKFSGLSNRSPRLERRRAWDKIIQESECRTKIIQI